MNNFLHRTEKPLDQPPPKPGVTDVTPIARERMLARFDSREAKGIETYGTTLQTHNGRDPYEDLEDEWIDGFKYMEQARLEHLDALREIAELKARLAEEKELGSRLWKACSYANSALYAIEHEEHSEFIAQLTGEFRVLWSNIQEDTK